MASIVASLTVAVATSGRSIASPRAVSPPLLARDRPLFFVLGVVEKTPESSTGRTRYPTVAGRRGAQTRRTAERQSDDRERGRGAGKTALAPE